MNLMDAHREWRDRPKEERFYTLAQLHAVVSARRQATVASRVRTDLLKFEAAPVLEGGRQELVIAGAQAMAVPSHWAFTQLADYLRVPAPYLRRLPADLTAQLLNHGAKTTSVVELEMVWANGAYPGVVRGFNTPSYQRLWDEEVIRWLRMATQDEQGGWRRPPAITDDKYPSGYYAGDRNIFVFMVNDEARLDDGEQGLGRGFFVWNSEVKQMSFGLKAFYYQYVCGNHIVWGAQELLNVRLPHVGADMVQRAAQAFHRALAGYAGASAAKDQQAVNLARQKQIAKKPEEAAEVLMKVAGFTRAHAVAVVAEVEQAGKDPTNLWQLYSGATRCTQKLFHYADERNAADQRAARLMKYVDF